MSLNQEARDALKDLEEAGLLRTTREIQTPQGAEVVIDGQPALLFCSNDYLGLANHPRLIQAAHEALNRYGVGAAASRLISGTMTPHREAEQNLAALVGQPSAILYSSGYAANVGTLSTLARPGDLILSDALNHASLIDGCRLSRARIEVYRHADPEHLRALLDEKRSAHPRAFVVTDGLFSMDGDRAPLASLREIADRYDASLIVDEAHSLGVLGEGGSGACAEAGVRPDVFIGTLGKAFGCAGAFAAAGPAVIDLLRNRARSFVFSTAPPPATAAVAAAAAELVRGADDRRARLRRHSLRLRAGLRELGYQVPDDDTPIVPVMIGDPRQTMRISNDLLESGFFVHGIRPPTVPEGTSRLRLVPTAGHEDDHIERLLEAFARLRR